MAMRGDPQKAGMAVLVAAVGVAVLSFEPGLFRKRRPKKPKGPHHPNGTREARIRQNDVADDQKEVPGFRLTANGPSVTNSASSPSAPRRPRYPIA